MMNEQKERKKLTLKDFGIERLSDILIEFEGVENRRITKEDVELEKLQRKYKVNEQEDHERLAKKLSLKKLLHR